MYGSWVQDVPQAVQLVMAISCSLMGASHVLHPRMWLAFFTLLHGHGTSGVLAHTFVFVWPALGIVVLHPVWSGPGVVLTVYGWALLAKATIAFLVPSWSTRSLAMSQRGERGFVAGGVGMLFVGGCSAAAWWLS